MLKTLYKPKHQAKSPNQSPQNAQVEASNIQEKALEPKIEQNISHEKAMAFLENLKNSETKINTFRANSSTKNGKDW